MTKRPLFFFLAFSSVIVGCAVDSSEADPSEQDTISEADELDDETVALPQHAQGEFCTVDIDGVRDSRCFDTDREAAQFAGDLDYFDETVSIRPSAPDEKIDDLSLPKESLLAQYTIATLYWGDCEGNAKYCSMKKNKKVRITTINRDFCSSSSAENKRYPNLKKLGFARGIRAVKMGRVNGRACAGTFYELANFKGRSISMDPDPCGEYFPACTFPYSWSKKRFEGGTALSAVFASAY